MKLLMKQRMASLFFDIFDTDGNALYVVKGEIAWGSPLRFYDVNEMDVACIRGEYELLLRRFEMYIDSDYAGSVSREFSLRKARFDVDYNGWQMDCDVSEREYTITTVTGQRVASASRKLWNWKKTYEIDIRDPKDVLPVLMLILAAVVEKSLR